MTVNALLTRTITITHRAQTGPVDRNNVPTWETTTSTAPGVVFPKASSEITADEQTQIGTHTGFLPIGAAIDGSDELEDLGVMYRVIGPPRRWRSPLISSTNDFTEVDLEVVS